MGNLKRVKHIQVCNPGLHTNVNLMTTDRKPMSGRGQESNKLDSYMKNSKKSAVGNFMRTFSRTKTTGLITSWDDTHYFSAKNATFKCLADTTGNVDSATVASPLMVVLMDILWETYYENANLKDLVANDETAWKLYFSVMAQICFDFQIMYNMRCYLPAYTESDIVPGSSTNISYFTQSSFDIFISSMKEFPVPKGIYELVDIFCTWVVKYTQEYERHTLRLPAAIFQPFTSFYDLADFEAMRDLLRVNLGGMTTHAKKFGLGVSSWRDPIKPIEKTISDPDVIAYFNHSSFKWYDNTPATAVCLPNGGFPGNNLTTDYSSTEYAFKDSPNESKIHVLAPLLGVYDATNNAYGGLIVQQSPNAAEYYVNLLHCAQHATAMTAADMGNAILTDALLMFHKAASDNLSALFSLQFSGTNFTAVRGLDDVWPLAYHNNCFYGAGRGATETNNDLLNFLGRALR